MVKMVFAAACGGFLVGVGATWLALIAYFRDVYR